MNHGYADVSYEETPELIAAEKRLQLRESSQIDQSTSQSQESEVGSVDLDDLGRLPIFERLYAFVDLYPSIRKGSLSFRRFWCR